MRRFLALGLALATAALAAACAVRWRDGRLLAALARVAQDTPVPLPAQRADEFRARAVAGARAMTWLPYDPFMGTHGDPLGPWGFVVCIDVPLRAYRAAGVPLASLLKESAAAHPGWFKLGPDNAPGNRFFYRRVRNYNDLFRNHPALEASPTPHPGDLAFFGRWHIALVTEAAPDGTWRAVEATPRVWGVKESGSGYLVSQWGEPEFFGRVRAAGQVLSSPHESAPPPPGRRGRRPRGLRASGRRPQGRLARDA
ncbi:hypothetical protein EPO15_18640 [bacterium]|nr:MAG: hypothetical protein EPO15_18640 [bacterium]